MMNRVLVAKVILNAKTQRHGDAKIEQILEDALDFI